MRGETSRCEDRLDVVKELLRPATAFERLKQVMLVEYAMRLSPQGL